MGRYVCVCHPNVTAGVSYRGQAKRHACLHQDMSAVRAENAELRERVTRLSSALQHQASLEAERNACLAVARKLTEDLRQLRGFAHAHSLLQDQQWQSAASQETVGWQR